MRSSFVFPLLIIACGADFDTGSNPSSAATSPAGTRPPDGVDAGSNPVGPAAATPLAPSCARARGGRTCGPAGDEDCCATAQQGSYTIDKYMITGGRVRAFIEQFQGNIGGYVASLGAKWNPQWNDGDALPVDNASADVSMSAYLKKACDIGPRTGRTYWTPKTEGDASDFDRDTLDDKAVNCVSWQMLQALCIWDGGHLATLAELEAAFTNGGTTKYPWGDTELPSVAEPDPEQRLNIAFGFKTTPSPASLRDPAEAAFFIAPPGRYPKGNNKAQIADSAGNLLEWVGDQKRQFVWKGDWENHAQNASDFNGSIWWKARNDQPRFVGRGPWIWGEGQLYGQAGTTEERNGYYAIGGRCAH